MDKIPHTAVLTAQLLDAIEHLDTELDRVRVERTQLQQERDSYAEAYLTLLARYRALRIDEAAALSIAVAVGACLRMVA